MNMIPYFVSPIIPINSLSPINQQNQANNNNEVLSSKVNDIKKTDDETNSDVKLLMLRTRINYLENENSLLYSKLESIVNKKDESKSLELGIENKDNINKGSNHNESKEIKYAFNNNDDINNHSINNASLEEIHHNITNQIIKNAEGKKQDKIENIVTNLGINNNADNNNNEKNDLDDKNHKVIIKLKSVLKDKIKKICFLEQELEHKSKENEELNNNYNALNLKYEGLSKELRSHEVKNKKIDDLLKKSKEENSNLVQFIDKLKEDLTGIKKKVFELENERILKNEEHFDLTQKRQELETKISRQDVKFNKLKDEFDSLNYLHHNLKKENSKIYDKIDDLKENNFSLIEENKEISSKLKILEKDHKELMYIINKNKLSHLLSNSYQTLNNVGVAHGRISYEEGVRRNKNNSQSKSKSNERKEKNNRMKYDNNKNKYNEISYNAEKDKSDHRHNKNNSNYEKSYKYDKYNKYNKDDNSIDENERFEMNEINDKYNDKVKNKKSFDNNNDNDRKYSLSDDESYNSDFYKQNYEKENRILSKKSTKEKPFNIVKNKENTVDNNEYYIEKNKSKKNKFITASLDSNLEKQIKKTRNIDYDDNLTRKTDLSIHNTNKNEIIEDTLETNNNQILRENRMINSKKNATHTRGVSSSHSHSGKKTNKMNIDTDYYMLYRNRIDAKDGLVNLKSKHDRSLENKEYLSKEDKLDENLYPKQAKIVKIKNEISQLNKDLSMLNGKKKETENKIVNAPDKNLNRTQFVRISNLEKELSTYVELINITKKKLRELKSSIDI